MNRQLDGIYFRIERNGEMQNICFSDLTDDEIDSITAGKSAAWWKSVAIHLRDCLKELGDELDIVKERF